MSYQVNANRFGLPGRFLTSLIIASAFMGFLVFDQSHWWKLKPDYAFGWLVPVFVVYVIMERWKRLRAVVVPEEGSPLSRIQRIGLSVVAGIGFCLGLLLFLLGAFYRAGAGVSQPGSLALAIGFSGILLGLVYFNTPEGHLPSKNPSAGGITWRMDARLRTIAIFLFPAFIWILSAPLLTAVENAISLFLLRKVVVVVFALFNFLGYTIVQEGNILVLPVGRVGVAEACSGIRSLTGCLFAGSFLAAIFLEGFWKKILLIGLSMGFAFFMNLLRSLFLTSWAYAYGSDAIEGKLHDATGLAVLGLTVVGLFMLLPLFRRQNWHRWLGLHATSPATTILPRAEIPASEHASLSPPKRH